MGNYAKGAEYERRAKAELEANGWIVTRSAGSKGAADLVAVKVRQIQVKVVERPKAWTSEIEKLREQLPEGPGMTSELWVWIRRHGWEKYKADGSK